MSCLIALRIVLSVLMWLSAATMGFMVVKLSMIQRVLV
jgi:hypothetical protein